MPPDPLVLACALRNIGSVCVYMGSYIIPYIQKYLEILPDQCKIASSSPAKRYSLTLGSNSGPYLPFGALHGPHFLRLSHDNMVILQKQTN